MGVAAYNRGSRAISIDLQREAYARGASPFNPDALQYKPKPRSASWGEKALAKAVERVRKQVRGAERVAAARGESLDVDALLDYLPDYLWTQHGVARETAWRAVEVVRAEHGGSHRNPLDRAALERELRECEDKIQAAYWNFTRQARAKPPSLVVPEAYRRRTEIRRLLGLPLLRSNPRETRR